MHACIAICVCRVSLGSKNKVQQIPDTTTVCTSPVVLLLTNERICIDLILHVAIRTSGCACPIKRTAPHTNQQYCTTKNTTIMLDSLRTLELIHPRSVVVFPSARLELLPAVR